MSRQTHSAEFDALAVRNSAIRLHGCVGQLVTPKEISFAAARHQLAVELARHHFRAGAPSEFRESAAVIEMRVTIQQKFHVPWLKTELLDVCDHLWQHLDRPSVQNNVPRGSDD